MQRPEYSIAYERAQGMTLGHVQVRRWSHAVSRRYLRDVETAQGLLGEPVFALHNPEFPNQRKFLEFSGFVPIGSAWDAGGRSVTLFERPFHGQPLRRIAKVHHAD